MENSSIGPLVDAGRMMTNEESLVTGAELALNNNYDKYYNCNNDVDEDDDDVLIDVLTQVRHAYVPLPATSVHGTIYDTL